MEQFHLIQVHCGGDGAYGRGSVCDGRTFNNSITFSNYAASTGKMTVE